MTSQFGTMIPRQQVKLQWFWVTIKLTIVKKTKSTRKEHPLPSQIAEANDCIR